VDGAGIGSCVESVGSASSIIRASTRCSEDSGDHGVAQRPVPMLARMHIRVPSAWNYRDGCCT
jgi:hypothetical protein